MAKTRKKYNKMKQLNRLADHLLKDIVVCYVDNLKGCVMVDTKHDCIIQPSEAMIASASRPHNWSCYISVFGRNQLGEEYMKSEQIFTPAKYYQADLAPVFEVHHSNLIKQMPEHHLCGVGWIASTRGEELTESEAGRIFTKLGAWDE